MSEDKSLEELASLQEYLYRTIGTRRSNPSFACKVVYKTSAGTISETTTAIFQTESIGWGTIRIDEKGKLLSSHYHLDFDPKWQKMEFNQATNSLEIKGKSDKMKGKYHVSIEPI